LPKKNNGLEKDIETSIELFPVLRPVLVKICKRWQKKGILSGRMSLGKNTGHDQAAPFEYFFGSQSIKYPPEKPAYISLDKFSAARDNDEISAWLAALHNVLGLDFVLVDKAKETQLAKINLLLGQLKLEYPGLKAIHDFLALKVTELMSQMEYYGEDELRKLFFSAGEIVDFLVNNNEIYTMAELAARFSDNSKSLRNGRLRKQVEEWLLLIENEQSRYFDETMTIWERFRIINDRLTVQAIVFGPVIYQKNNKVYDWIYQLWKSGEAATLSWSNLSGIQMKWADDYKAEKKLITCENEAPFSRMIREKQSGILLFSKGFPNDAVKQVYKDLAPQSFSCLHWGDSDLAGLQIAAILNSIHPLFLFRCNLPTLEKHQEQLLILPDKMKRKIELFLENNPDFPFSAELEFTCKHGWLEQESWLQNLSESTC
jgi:hypothetical protein